MKRVINAEWTRQGNVLVELQEVVDFIPSGEKQIPVTKRGIGQKLTIEIEDKNIEKSSDVKTATDIIFAELNNKGIEVYKELINIF